MIDSQEIARPEIGHAPESAPQSPRDMRLAFFRSHARYMARAGETGDAILARLKKDRDRYFGVAVVDPALYVTDQELLDIAASANEAAPPVESQTDAVPSALMLPPDDGIIGRTIDYTLKTSHRQQPAFALAAAIALVAVITGRKVRDAFNTRTNLNLVCVGPSGCGKDRARHAVREILHLAGGDALIGPEGLSSGAGFVSLLEEHPACLFFLDEFGRLLKCCNDFNQSHLRVLVSHLLSLNGSAHTIWRPDGYADREKNRSIDQPNPVIVGTTVPKSLCEAMTTESLTDGFISRLLVFETTNVPPRQLPEAIDPPAELVKAVERWVRFVPSAGNIAHLHPGPLLIPHSDATRERLTAFMDESDERANATDDSDGASLWRRAPEAVNKLALIHTCSRQFDNPRIEVESLEWAIGLTMHLTSRLLTLARYWISDSLHEANVNRILRIIRSAGGKGISKRELGRKTRWLKPNDRDSILIQLIDSEAVLRLNMTSGGRPGELYKLV